MTSRRDPMAALQIRDGLFAGFNAVQKIALMAPIITDGIAGFVFHGLRPLLRLFGIQLGFQLRTSDRMTPRKHFGDDIVRRYLRVGPDLKTSAGDRQRAIGAMEEQPAHALASAPSRA